MPGLPGNAVENLRKTRVIQSCGSRNHKVRLGSFLEYSSDLCRLPCFMESHRPSSYRFPNPHSASFPRYGVLWLGCVMLAGCSDCGDSHELSPDAAVGLDGAPTAQDGGADADADGPQGCVLDPAPAGPLVLTPPSAAPPLQGIFRTGDPVFFAGVSMRPTPDEAYILGFDFVENGIKAFHRRSGSTPHGGRTQLLSGEGVGTGPTFDAGPIVFNDAATLAYVHDGTALLEVDLATGARRVVSGAAVGSGPPLVRNSTSLVLNAAETNAYSLDTLGGQLMRVDLCTGNRTLVTAGGEPGVGPELEITFDLVINQAETLAYVVDNGNDSVVSVDLATGDRVVVSNASTGSGPELGTPTALLLFDEETKAYVLDQGGDVYTVDLATGDRAVLPNDSAGPFARLRETNNMVLAPDGVRLLLESTTSKALIAVEPNTGARSLYHVGRVGESDSEEGCPFGCVWRHAKIEAAGQRFVFVAPTAVWSSSFVDGNRSLLSGDGRGTGPAFEGASSHDLDSDGVHAYVTDRGRLIEVEIENGNRRIVSDTNNGSGPAWSVAAAVALNSTDTTAYVMVGLSLNSSLVAVDLSTGDRTVISSNDVGSGPMFRRLSTMALSGDEATVYVGDVGLQALFAVDTTTGERTVVSQDGAVGTGDRLFFPRGLALDEAAGVAFVGSNIDATQAILEVDLATGDRSILSDASLGGAASVVEALDYDSARQVLIASDVSLGVVLIDRATGDRFIHTR